MKEYQLLNDYRLIYQRQLDEYNIATAIDEIIETERKIVQFELNSMWETCGTNARRILLAKDKFIYGDSVIGNIRKWFIDEWEDPEYKGFFKKYSEAMGM